MPRLALTHCRSTAPLDALPDEVPAELLPSDEDVALYRERGYYISQVVLDEAVIDAAAAGAERFYAGDFDEPAPPVPDGCVPTGPPYSGLRKHDYARLRNRDLERLVLQPVLGAIAARLAGTEAIRLWHDQLLYKPPDQPGTAANVGWHTDRSYWLCCSSDDMLTAWVPFHDCDESMGTVTMVEGSHRWPGGESGSFFDQDLEGTEARLQAAGLDLVKVPMALKKGQVSFHSCRTLHGSGPNRSDRPRRSIAVHLQDAANHYRSVVHPDGTTAGHLNNGLARRVDDVPDYTDPAYFPVLWPRS